MRRCRWPSRTSVSQGHRVHRVSIRSPSIPDRFERQAVPSAPPRRWTSAALIAGAAVLAGVVAVARSQGGESAFDRDIPRDAWSLVGVVVSSDGKRTALVRLADPLGTCESSSASADQAQKSRFVISVRRIRDGCSETQSALGIPPKTLRVSLPGTGPLTGQSIGGPGYRGAAMPADSLRDGVIVPSVIGLRPSVAKELVQANGLTARAASSRSKYVRTQAPAAGTELRRPQGLGATVTLR